MDSNSEVNDKPAALAAMQTVGSALYYLLWHAYGHAHVAGRVTENDIPSEIWDVTEKELLMVERDSHETGLMDDAWLAKVYQQVKRDYAGRDPYELGPAIPHGYFSTIT